MNNVYQDAMLITENQVFESKISNKIIVEYGQIKSVSSDGTTCSVVLQNLLTFNGKTLEGPVRIDMVELLYLNSSSMSIDMVPEVGDPVLLLGLRNQVLSTATPMPVPAKASNYESYSLGTLKAIPLSAINSGSEVTFRAKNGKVRLRNSTVSMFKILNDFQTAISTFSNATSQSSITAGGTAGAPYTTTLASNLVALMSAMNASLVSVANEISALLED